MSSYQLLTTKRKFERLLDQVTYGGRSFDSAHDVVVDDGAAPASPGAMAVTSSEPTTKRRRLTPTKPRPLPRERSTFVKSLPHLSLLLAQQARKVSQQRDFTIPAQKNTMAESRFNPISQDDFLDRLKSFSSVSQWAPKPDIINEVAWAKRGWRLVRPETVSCEGCHAFQVIDMAFSHAELTSEQEDARLGLASRYAERIVAAHADGCLWRTMGCNDTIHKVKIWPAEEAIRHLLERYRRLMQKSETLPNAVTFGDAQIDVNLAFHALLSLFPSAAEGINISEESLTSSGGISAIPEIRLRAVGMALAGWNVVDTGGESTYTYAECGMCFRRVGLWLYKPATGAQSSEGGTDDIRPFDAVTEHRDYCPWANSTAQCPYGFTFEPAQTATELLGKDLFAAALSKARRLDQGTSPTHPAPDNSPHTQIVLAHPLRAHPVGTLPSRAAPLFSRPEVQDAQQQQLHGTAPEAAEDVEAADEQRRERLKGIRRFLGKFKDIGKSGIGKLKKKTPE